jgi:hypothetical protein
VAETAGKTYAIEEERLSAQAFAAKKTQTVSRSAERAFRRWNYCQFGR